MHRYDFLVVGSGIAGSSIASELAATAKVLLIERESCHGYHTTGRSAAMFIESYGNAWIRRLTGASRGFFDSPPDGFCSHALLKRRGSLTIATRDQISALEVLAADVKATGSEVQQIDGEAARALTPILRRDRVAQAVFEPNSCDIDTHGLHGGFLCLARARGADVRLNAGVEGIERRTAGWRISLAGGAPVEARVIVNAAGAWADVIAGMAGVRPIGLEPRRRTALLIDPPVGLPIDGWPTVMDVDERFYFKPESGSLLASPADETPSAPVDAAPEEIDIAECIDRIELATTLCVTQVRRSWAGLRTFAPDRTPVFGYDPDVADFFWFAGQGGYGMQTAPGAARLAAALALGQAIPPDLGEHGLGPAPFCPSRFR